MSKVSIVIPTYRRPDLLAQALASAIQQTLQDIEILVCDNAADPASEAVVRQCNDPRIVYAPRPQNLGMLRNALLGFEQASSPLIMKLDDDDLLYPDALERLVWPFARHPEVMISFGGVDLMDEESQPLPRDTAFLNRKSGRDGLPEGLIRSATDKVTRGAGMLSAAVFRKDVVDWSFVPEYVATSYDLYLCLKAVENDRPAWFTSPPVMIYRVHSRSDTHINTANQVHGACAILTDAIEGGRHENLVALRRRLAEVMVMKGKIELQDERRPEARITLRRANRLTPTVAGMHLLVSAYLPSVVFKQSSRLRSQFSRRVWTTVSWGPDEKNKNAREVQ